MGSVERKLCTRCKRGGKGGVGCACVGREDWVGCRGGKE